ncbi:MAG: ABC transporter ATP-binding protein [Acidobacteria bacterium]|nr:ABC transporter ATP-binding protein [Acidobacteriota bacterium]MBV9476317.1 ABC transporter ATP-binding protein [Acidobacteriota bacterium]
MRILLPYLKQQWRALIATFAAATVAQLLQLADPQILRVIVDKYVQHVGAMPRDVFFRGVLLLIGASIVVSLLARLFRSLQEYTINTIARRVGASLYAKSVAHSLLMPYSVFENQRSGELLHTIQRARTDAESGISGAVRLYLGGLAIVAVTIYAFTVHPLLGVLHVVAAPVVAIVTITIGRPIRRHQFRITRESAALAGTATEAIRNIELVKSLGIETQEIGRMTDVNDRILALEQRKLQLIRLFMFIVGSLIHVTRAVLLIVMLWLVYDHSITTGEFLSLFLYSNTIFMPLAELGTAVARYQEARATFDTLDTVLDQPKEERPAEAAAIGPIAEVAFDRVTLVYDPSHLPALHDVTLTLRAGETVAFAGPSGSGKSSLVKLLVGLYTPTSGVLRVNGHDLAGADLDAFRARIGLVTQETQLFAGTLRDNLQIARPNATDEQCLAVLERAAASPILTRGGQGLDTRIGEGGIKLSGGERQRVAIARALLRDPDLLVFDEATSNLDSITERAITETIRVVSADARLTVLVAHRLSTIAHADRIHVLRAGAIVETGTHAELLARDGLYASLWREQSGVKAFA